nr:MAG TPA: hypothetical protein [Caudoviricetes sp.]
MGNSYNYSDQSLNPGAGAFEHMARSGLVNNDEGIYTPKSDSLVVGSSIEVADLPADQVIPNFDKRKAPVWTRTTEHSQEIVQWDGAYKHVFLQGNEKEARAWLASKLDSGMDKFIESVDEDNNIVYTLSAEDAKPFLLANALNLVALREAYNKANELTDELTDVERNVPGDVSEGLTLKDMNTYTTDAAIERDLKLFEDHPSNYAARMFGPNTNADMGCYYDNSGRIRVAYNSFLTHLAKPLIKDLLEFAKPDQYCVGRFPEGTLIFVLEKDLVKFFINKFGGSKTDEDLEKTENAIAARWTAFTGKEGPTKDDLKEFEATLDLKTKRLVNVNTIYGLDAAGKK